MFQLRRFNLNNLRPLPLALPLLMVSFLTACGPVYRTEYTFKPPRTATGRNCAFQCETSRGQCRQIEDLRVDRCEDNSRREVQDCEDRLRWDKNRDSKWYECTGDSCTADYDRCDELYRSCYQSCGGNVTSQTVCVANCEKARE